MMIVAARKERFTGKHLAKDTPDRPYIDSLGILLSIISGARYHRVATYSDMKPVSIPDGSAVFTDRARPKPQTFKSQWR